MLTVKIVQWCTPHRFALASPLDTGVGQGGVAGELAVDVQADARSEQVAMK